MMNPGSKYVQLLQGQPSPNNGTVAGGLGHVLQQALLGYSMGEEKRQQDAKQGKLTELLRMYIGTPENTITWNQETRPDGTGDPTTTIPGKEPNRWGAIYGMAELDPGLAFQMANSDYNFQRQQDAAGNELVQVANPNGDGSMIFLPRSQVTAGMVAENAPQFTPDIQTIIEGGTQKQGYFDQSGNWVEMGSGPRWQSPQAPQPQMVKGIDGRQYWATGPNAGQPVLPDEQPGQTPPFEGTGMDAQLMNVLLTGDPMSPEYLAAYNQMAAPKTILDQASGQMYTITPNMSAFHQPGTGSTPAPVGDPSQAGLMQPTMGSQGGVDVAKIGDGKFTVDQTNAALFATMMQGADSVITDLPQDVQTSFWESAISGVPVAGNYANSSDYQRYKQATDDFINAWLRRTSGAAIQPSEYAAAAQQFFPQPGDKPEVIAQKAASRQRAMDGLISAAGGAYTPAPNTGETDTVIDYDANGNRL